MKLIGVIGAMDVEIKAVTDAMEEKEEKSISGVTFTKGKIGENYIVCAVCGIGKVFASLCCEAMILSYKPDCIINTGVAGTLSEKINILDTVCASYVCQHDMDTSFLGDPVGLISGINMIKFPCDIALTDKLYKIIEKNGGKAVKGTVASGDIFVSENERKEKIRDSFDAVACEMEGGAIGHTCYVNNIPFAVLRTISDGENDNHMSYMEFRDIAAEKSSKVIIDLVREGI